MEWKRPARWAVLVALIMVLSAVFVYPLFVPDGPKTTYHAGGAYVDANGKGVWVTGKVGPERLQVMKEGIWSDILIKGVNIGAAKPGYFPGEAAITYEEYVRWFDRISDMNANAIRIYTHHPPAFYEALLKHNRRRADPLYLFQGVTIDELNVISARDTFNQSVLRDMQKNIMDDIDVIHGNAYLAKRPGVAGGNFNADVSEYVLGLIIGIELDSLIVNHTDHVNRGMADLEGDYFITEDASPTEIWIASSMELAASYESENYGSQRPISFVNWPTTDPMKHPYEPAYFEDLVGIDQNHIKTRPDFYPGQFSSFHVYPYYPDFMDLEPGYLNYTNSEGRISNYAGYLNDLNAAHSMPIIVAEYGTPSSRASAHFNTYGMDHGKLTEWQQGQYDAMLFSDIVSEGLAGGFLFSWQDEWFKRAWNTMDHMDPGRRPYWFDVQTCEQNYGMLYFEPWSKHRILTDGEKDDWKGISPLGKGEGVMYNLYQDGYDEGRELKALYAWSDAAYLYMRVDYEDLGGVPNWEDMNALILMDTVQGQGNTHIPFGTGLRSERGIDLLIHLNNTGSRVMVDSYYDSNYYDYAIDEAIIPRVSRDNISDSGTFHRIELTENRGYLIKPTKEVRPYNSYETGLLRWGISDPQSYNFNSLSDIWAGDDCIEMRIPWLMLNFRDPSRKVVQGDLWQGGFRSDQRIDGIRLAVMTFDPNENGTSVPGENHPAIADSIPHPLGGILREDDFLFYTWDNWDVPKTNERLKESYILMQEEYGRH